MQDIEQLLNRMTDDLRAHISAQGLSSLCPVGIRTGGVWVAQALRRRLGIETECGELDITFYRDDFSRIGLHPRISPSRLPYETEGQNLLLVDDVIMSGRTIRAAMNELFDYGRPESITLATLVDLGRRELPIQPDVTGIHRSLGACQRIKLQGPEPLELTVEEVPDA
ncbi:bifunctional pyr operon transcriptional regulator/uracil phosphoribosyltransferase PyrR [Salicola sp. Rm-C-2C1-2]|uniref:bifunctional pyr operon transcriptional regulator/uracil phosphoribosyltransferase PyrR n=1 Tax=Salicola sp. Rm-C-2C1-2 TaxID=3141321 RepID=UPI0032E41EB5